MSDLDAYNAELERFLAAFGANVRRIRVAKRPRCSQERLSFLTRLHRTEIGRIEQGAVEPRLSTLVILAEGLGVGVEELVGSLCPPQRRKPAPNGQSWS